MQNCQLSLNIVAADGTKIDKQIKNNGFITHVANISEDPDSYRLSIVAIDKSKDYSAHITCAKTSKLTEFPPKTDFLGRRSHTKQ